MAALRRSRTAPGEPVLVVEHVGALTAAIAALCPDRQMWGRPLPHAVPIGGRRRRGLDLRLLVHEVGTAVAAARLRPTFRSDRVLKPAIRQ